MSGRASADALRSFSEFLTPIKCDKGPHVSSRAREMSFKGAKTISQVTSYEEAQTSLKGLSLTKTVKV